jgi:catechol 2,3-dioxygenase-like lactoylglutathione lyase family enzyme
VSTTAEIVTGVDFVPVPTRNLEAAARFYGETLGLPRSVYRPDRHFAEFETGNLTLSVIDGDAMGIGHHVNHNAIALQRREGGPADARAARDRIPGRHV